MKDNNIKSFGEFNENLNISDVSGRFPIKDTYTKEEVKEIARAFTRAATPSEFIRGIDERFDKLWKLNFGS
jgi:hypothetical protein